MAGGNNSGPIGITLEDLEKALKDLNLTVGELSKALKRPKPAAPKKDRYEEMLEEARNKQDSLSTYIKRFGEDGGTQKWLGDQREKIRRDSSMSPQQKLDSNRALAGFVELRKNESSEEKALKVGENIGNILSGTLDDIVLDFENFDDSMKKLSQELTKYMIKEGLKLLKNNVLPNTWKANTTGFLSGSQPGKGFGGPFGSIINGIGHSIGLWHSGGVIPNVGSYSLSGTQEQLAILKGGERVLSPGENVQYQSGSSGSQPVVVNHFNVKAWDSKDVAQYFKDNKNLLNGITFEAIKSNNNQLRSLISNL